MERRERVDVTPNEERHLYETDRFAWVKYIAPRWAAMLKTADEKRKRELWGIASQALRDELIRLSKES